MHQPAHQTASSPTPEQVVIAMSYDELTELLSDLMLDASLDAAIKLKRLVRKLGTLEEAFDHLSGSIGHTKAA